MSNPTSTTVTPTQATTQTPQTGTAEVDDDGDEAGYTIEAEDLASEAFDALANMDDDGIATLDGEGEVPAAQGGAPVVDPATQVSPDPNVTAQTAPTTPVDGAPLEQPASAAAPAATPQPGQDGTAQQPAAPATAEQTTQTATGAAVGGTEFISQVREKLNESRSKFEEVLSTQVYGMTEEEATEVLTDPQKVLPKLAARVHIEATQNILGTMASVLPSVIMGVIEAQRQNTQQVDEFYSKWPALKKESDGQVVMAIARTYRAQNPNASKEEFIKNVGAMALVQLGRLPVAPPQPGQVVVSQAQPAAYRPAAAVPGTVQPAPPTNDFWSGVADQLNE